MAEEAAAALTAALRRGEAALPAQDASAGARAADALALLCHVHLAAAAEAGDAGTAGARRAPEGGPGAVPNRLQAAGEALLLAWLGECDRPHAARRRPAAIPAVPPGARLPPALETALLARDPPSLARAVQQVRPPPMLLPPAITLPDKPASVPSRGRCKAVFFATVVWPGVMGRAGAPRAAGAQRGARAAVPPASRARRHARAIPTRRRRRAVGAPPARPLCARRGGHRALRARLCTQRSRAASVGPRGAAGGAGGGARAAARGARRASRALPGGASPRGGACRGAARAAARARAARCASARRFRPPPTLSCTRAMSLVSPETWRQAAHLRGWLFRSGLKYRHPTQWLISKYRVANL